MMNILSLKMWFNLYPGALTPFFQYALITLVVVFLAMTVLVKFKYKQNKKTLYGKSWLSLFNFSVTGLVIGIFMLFFTYETVAFLSARFWFLVWFLIHAVWGYSIYRRLKRLPDIRQEIEKRKEFNKYIPK